MRDGTIAALRSQLALALSQLFVITRFEEPSAETLQAVEFDALFAGRYPRGDRPTH